MFACVESASGQLAMQQMAPRNINYLAHLAESNKSYYDHFVMGVAQFSGSGVAEANGGQANPMLTVDMGTFGTVSCLSTDGGQSGLPLPNLKPGDRASISGSVGGASTGASMSQITEERKRQPHAAHRNLRS